MKVSWFWTKQWFDSLYTDIKIKWKIFWYGKQSLTTSESLIYWFSRKEQPWNKK